MKHKVLSWKPTPWAAVGSTSTTESTVIRLVEKLHSADNPTEIAHGFPVRKVENKYTPVEYLVKEYKNILKLMSRESPQSNEL